MALLTRLLALVTVALLPAIATLVYNEIDYRRTREAEIHEQALHFAYLVSAEQDRIVEGVRSTLVALAQLPQFAAHDGAGCFEQLHKVRSQSPSFESIAAIDADGTLLCDGGTADGVPADLDRRIDMRHVLAAGGFAVDGMIGRDAATPDGAPRLAISYPFRDEAGAVRGVLVAALRLDWLAEQVRPKSLPSNASVTVADRDGHMLVRLPEAERAGDLFPESWRWMITAKKPATKAGFGIDGLPRIIAYLPAAQSPNGLFVSVGIDAGAAFAAIHRATKRGLAVILAGILVSLLAAWFGARHFLRPVGGLMAAVAAWQRGDYQVRAGVRTHSELGRLGEAFDRMAEALGDRERLLEEKAQRARHAAALLTDALESTTDCVFMLDREWRVSYLNRHAERMMAGRGPHLVGTCFWDIFPESRGSIFERNYGRVMEEGQAISFAAYSVALARWVEVNVYPSADGIAVYYRDVSERKRAEEERERLIADLEIERARFSAIVENIPVGLLLAEAGSGRIVTGNRRAEEILRRPMLPVDGDGDGDTGGEVLPAACCIGFRPDGKPLVADEWPLARALRGETVRGDEILYHGEDGAVSWIRMSSAPVRDRNGAIVGGVLALFDIGPEKQAEAALRDSRQRLQLAQDAAGIGTWDWDLRTGDVRWSPEEFKLFGVDPATARPDTAAPDEEAIAGAGIVTGEIFRACLHPDDRRRVDAEFRAAIAMGGLLETEFRVVRSDGVRWMVARGKVVADRADIPVRLIGVNWDVTERRAAETALREMNETLELRVRERTAQLAASEARHRAFFENAPEYLFLLRATRDGTLVYDDVNPAAEQLYAAPRGALLGRTVREVLEPEWAAEIEGYAGECIVTGRRQQALVQRSFPAGPSRLIDLVVAPVPITEGQDRLVIVSGRDVTESKRAEEQLAHAQRLEAVGQLTGGVAHDFNNLLTVVIGNLDFVKTRARDDEKLWRIADNAQRAAERGARLTAQLLAFARKQRLKPETVHVGRAIGDIRELVRRAIGETIKIRITVAQDLWSCHLDAAQFEAAILNLTINARDAMPNGGTLTIRTVNKTVDRDRAKSLGLPPGDYVRVVVSDTGTGMSPEVMQRAFEPFFTTKPVGKGTGLGLSQLYGFIRQSGGTVTIESAFGEGTSVALYLPRTEAGAETGAAAAKTDPSGHTAAAERPALPVGRTVLAVEDEGDVLQVIEASLGALGCRVVTARDGAEALRVLEGGGKIDLLFTDIVMPNGMSGVELARTAQRLHPGIKVLLTTGYARDVQNDGDEYDVIDKPYRRDELVQRVGAIFEPKETAAAPVHAAALVN